MTTAHIIAMHSVVRHSSKTESVSWWSYEPEEARKESLLSFLGRALLELLVPASDIVWRGAVVVHGVLIEVGCVEVGLDGGDDGGTQAAHPQSCNKISVKTAGYTFFF